MSIPVKLKLFRAMMPLHGRPHAIEVASTTDGVSVFIGYAEDSIFRALLAFTPEGGAQFAEEMARICAAGYEEPEAEVLAASAEELAKAEARLQAEEELVLRALGYAGPPPQEN